MSVASRAREVQRIKDINARTPDWARDQIKRRGHVQALERDYGRACSENDVVAKVTITQALASAMGAMQVLWRKRNREARADHQVLVKLGGSRRRPRSAQKASAIMFKGRELGPGTADLSGVETDE